MQDSAISREEFGDLAKWIESHGNELPEVICNQLKRVMAVYESLSLSVQRAKATLTSLRQAMGILPKSERGRGAGALPAAPPASLELNPPEDPVLREQYEKLKKKRNEAAAQHAEYDRELKALRGPKTKKDNPQMELDLAPANEMLFSFPVSLRQKELEKERVNRMQEFGKIKGLHSSSDKTKRVDVKIVVTDITYDVETVTDPETGKSVRASMAHVGPEKFQFTWGAIGNLIKLHVGFAIPINRLVLMLGQEEFSSSKICRVFQFVAMNLLPIYLHLAEDLSDIKILSGDDTPTKVLDLDDGEPDSLSKSIDEQFGWAAERADGKGEKKAVNVSLLVGRTDKDPRSTVRFFRTHVGSVGNIVTKILEWRKPKSGTLTFQGDLSTTNLPTEELQKKFGLAIAGCGAHARRPFWRFRSEDESLCYFMLRGFLLLTKIEKMIDAKGRTHANVLKLRTRYARWVWSAIKNRCIAAVTGQPPGPATYPKDIMPNVWPPGTELYKAAKYIINHFTELTLYLDHPALKYTNNGSERALRIEKCMLSGSKFRKTRNGRAILDVLRTINSTCTAANIDITDYLRYVFAHLNEIQESPQKFTPFAVALHFEKQKTM